MKIIKACKTNMEQVLQQAIEILKNGGIVAYPTETSYGLGAKFDLKDSLKKLYEIKQRPEDKAMPLIIGNKELLPVIADSVNSIAIKLMESFWPGPLTIIFPSKENLSEHITAGNHKVDVRIPGETIAFPLRKKSTFP